MENKINELKNIMNITEQNLMLLSEEDFNNVIEDYKTKKEMFVNLIAGIKNNTINAMEAMLSLDTLTSLCNEFNDNLCTNYSINATPCLAA
jgi:hypothetical protein